MKHVYTKNTTKVIIELGDITEASVDAIVNPANTLMIMGGGVAGAIKRKGGAVIEEEARKQAPIPIGKAILTTAGSLRAKFIIHAPTVEYPGSQSTREYVYKATKAALVLAREKGLRNIAFPLMGAGVGGLTPEESIEEMTRAIEEIGKDLEIHIVIRDENTLSRVKNHLERLGWKLES